MTTAVGWVVFLLALAGQSLLAAVVTRFFRIRMRTVWGQWLYALLATPFVLLFTTLILTGPLGVGPPLGGAVTALAVMIGVPLTLGVTLDLLYVPAPEEYELPANDSTE